MLKDVFQVLPTKPHQKSESVLSKSYSLYTARLKTSCIRISNMVIYNHKAKGVKYMKLLVLLLLTLSAAYRLVLDIVQYKSAGNPIPENVSDIYDAETYATWRRYSAENCRVHLISTVLSFLASLALLCTNAYAAFAALFGGGVFLQLLAVVILETAVDFVMSVGIQYYCTMVIEEKYGFNRSTLKTFVTDQIRNLLLNLVLNLLLAWLLSGLHRALGDWMIPLFAAAVFVFTLAISFLYPVFSRIGNKFVPLEDGELKDNLMALLNKHGYQVKAIEVMDASRRTTKLNAYFTGFGKMKTIVLYDNLVNAMSTDEICSVFAHELGHGLHKDVIKQQHAGEFKPTTSGSSRIDFVYCSPAMMKQVTYADVIRDGWTGTIVKDEATGFKYPSDHRPLIVYVKVPTKK